MRQPAETKTRVAFRILDDEVIALFVDDVNYPDGSIESYMHIGQHGAASPELQYTLEHATPAEYEALYNELTKQVGYDLDVLSE